MRDGHVYLCGDEDTHTSAVVKMSNDTIDWYKTFKTDNADIDSCKGFATTFHNNHDELVFLIES